MIKTEKVFKCIDEHRGDWLEVINSSREMILANLALIAQVPAPTFQESERSKFLVERLSESGAFEPTTDDLHNAIGKLPGEDSSRDIVLFTHMDSQLDASVDQNVSINESRVYGAGVANDNLALAVLMTMPDILQKIKPRLKSNLYLVATTKFHGRGDFGGIRHFMGINRERVDVAVNINGITIGNIDYFTLSRVRCDIRCEIDIEQDMAWLISNNDSAIMTMNDIVNSLYAIPLPRRPKTTLNVGMVSGGERYSTVSHEASASVEILSEDDATMDWLVQKITDECVDIGVKHGTQVATDFFGRHHASRLSASHPLMKFALEVIRRQGLQPSIEYSNSEIAVPLSMGIPSVSIGLTTGRSGRMEKSYVNIAPIAVGILQLLELIYAIDMGYETND